MGKYLKILAVLFVLYVLASAASAWYATAPYRPSHQANADRIGFPVEEVQFRTADGVTLRGWYSEVLESGPVVAIFHGHRATRMEGIALARALLVGGDNVLMMDLRGCGQSDGTAQHLGAKEALDVEASIRFLQEVKGYPRKQIGVLGIGSGASAAILARGSVRDVGGAVLMAPYVSLRADLDRGCKKLGGFGLDGIGLLFLEFVKMRIGQSANAVRPVDAIGDLSPCPVLLVGAALDPMSPPEEIQLLYSKARDPREMVVVPGITRERLTDLNGSDLRKRMMEFFDACLR